jgi:hypothetical protein
MGRLRVDTRALMRTSPLVLVRVLVIEMVSERMHLRGRRLRLRCESGHRTKTTLLKLNRHTTMRDGKNKRRSKNRRRMDA